MCVIFDFQTVLQMLTDWLHNKFLVRKLVVYEDINTRLMSKYVVVRSQSLKLIFVDAFV